MSTLSYLRAVETAQKAHGWAHVEDAQIAALNAQTFATLALVDELREHRKPAEVTTDEETSVLFVLAQSPRDAFLHAAKGFTAFHSLQDARAHKVTFSDDRALEVYQVTVEVVQQ